MALSACISEPLKWEINAEVGSPPDVKWQGQPVDVTVIEAAKTEAPHAEKLVFYTDQR